jgi:hypothetical protein
VAERKVLYSLSHRGRARVGANNIRLLSFPPPAPPNGRGVFVQPLLIKCNRKLSGSFSRTVDLLGRVKKSREKTVWFIHLFGLPGFFIIDWYNYIFSFWKNF